MSKKVRLDVLVFDRGLVSSRERARARIMAGDVFVGGERFDKAGTKVDPEVELELRGGGNPYVSRGGFKLAGALDAFEIPVEGMVAVDVGASTGGFTDCLLQRGAARVYTVDVGYGQLAWKLRQDPRVVNIERMNIRKLPQGRIPEALDFAVADCSFISLKKVLPHVIPLLKPVAELVVLVKPQFEAGRARLGKGGVVRDDGLRREIISEVADWCRSRGIEVRGGVDSNVAGPKGNVEHLLWLSRVASSPT